MRYFHCPTHYRARSYGCGAGPFDGTRTYLDYGGHCPRCSAKLVPFRKVAKPAALGGPCDVRSVMGTRYCWEPAVTGAYCRRHENEAIVG